MKSLSYSLLAGVMLTAFACKKDNYAPPSSSLTGTLLYKGDTVGVEYNQVPYQLYQFGFGKTGSIDGTFAPDGNMSQLLFNGNYKFIIPNGQGPFMWPQTPAGAPDSLSITMNGSQHINIEVTPFYMIRNAKITNSGGTLTANFKAEQIITDANAKGIERVVLFVDKTQFASNANPLASASINGGDITDPNNITITLAAPNVAPQKYVFARIAVKIQGVEDLLYGSVQQIPL
ncbi:DUF3823 domain-containing protein [Deminuibacter soli]|uniref:DUF3823 domain-containing protein n=1 Tax=Deminuibacter soli TaxID=2291815 RepID=A0A3E1NKN5_9BACT|nr:DUF3823 domain-containing protein [Deminuibacter soli]RFM28493.1 DUF3823 domain-containing protein [Deminuibacter soli]